MPTLDAWTHAIQFDSAPTSYTIYSRGKDGSGSDCAPGATTSFDAEICFSGGQFRRYPLGQQQ
jgi:hypothetical protein